MPPIELKTLENRLGGRDRLEFGTVRPLVQIPHADTRPGQNLNLESARPATDNVIPPVVVTNHVQILARHPDSLLAYAVRNVDAPLPAKSHPGTW